MDLIKQRDKRTIRRKIAKSKFDNMLTLSADADIGIRLLDEGSVVSSDGEIWFYIKKGTLRKYLDALDDDFVGYIKPFHIDFANFPLLLGQYRKSGLTLQDIGDGRQSLYVKPTWFDTYLLKDLKAMPYDMGVSVEMSVKPDVDATDKLGFPVYDELFITGFAVVGDAGNVNSSGVRLSGGENVDLKSINELLENQSQIDLSALKDALSKMDAKEVEAESAEADEVETEEVEASAENSEENEEVEASAEETDAEDILEKVEELTAKVEELTEENKTLSDQITALESDKTALTEQLSAKEAEEKKFVDKFKALTCHVSDPKPETKETDVSMVMDGIGEL